MIKTREDYERLNKAINTYGGKAYQDYKETIEALREVARAGKDMVTLMPDVTEEEHKLRAALDALPAWVLESED